MHRFFVSPEALKRRPVTLTGPQAHQLQRVLRLRPGETVILLDNSGLEYEAELTGYGPDEARFRVAAGVPGRGEPRLRLTLYQAVLKGERFAWLLQKGTELGVSRFVPLICQRSVVEDRVAIAGKRERWARIIQEAAEQSSRARLPDLAAPAAFADALRAGESSDVLRLIPWEAERSTGLREALASHPGPKEVDLFIGPEGGFTEEEVALAVEHGIRPITLGPRILRAETAGLAAAAAVMFAAGEMEA